jgi:membrane-associated phospholipid phosphatase
MHRSIPSLAAAATLVLVSASLFGILALLLKNGHTIGWDKPILVHLEHRVPFASDLVWPAAAIGPAIGVIAVLVLVQRQRHLYAGLWILAIGGALLLDPFFKHLVGRPPLRPVSTGFSFPSGSAMVLVAALIALGATSRIARRPPIVIAAIVVALTQGAILVSTQWHYPSDVVGGWLLTIAWTASVVCVVLCLSSRSAKGRLADRLESSGGTTDSGV